MKKLILLVLILSGIALAYFEQNDGVPEVFSQDGTQSWRLWTGETLSDLLFNDTPGILFDDDVLAIIIGSLSPGSARSGVTSVGYLAGESNQAFNTSYFGIQSGQLNTGNSFTVVGHSAGRFNDGDFNTAIGGNSFNTVTPDSGSAQNISSVDFANNQVTIDGGHGFSIGNFVNLLFSSTGSLPSGLSSAFPEVWEVVNSTVLECFSDSFTDAGTGTHTITPLIIYENSTALGYDAEPDASNQVVLGDTNVTEVKTTGAINAGGGLTLGGNIIIPDNGLIGSVSDTDAIQIEADGDVVMSQDLTVDGTISDGTATLTGGNYSSVGTITSGDITILDATPILVFKDSNSSGAASVGFIEWRDSGGGRAGFLGNNSSGNDDLFWKNEQGGNIGIQTTGAGKVQIFADVELNGSLTVDTDVLIVNAEMDTVKIKGTTSLGDGGTTDYTRWSTGGVQTMHGTARVKKHVQGIILAGRGANAPTVRVTEAPFLAWTFAVNDDTHMTIEVPKDMDLTMSVDVVAHWYTTDATANGVDSVNWQAQWNSRAVGETVNAGSTTDSSGDKLCGAQYAIVETMIETIPANSVTQDDHLGLDITRIALTAGTNPSPTATSVHIISVEIEYTANKLGKALEINLLLLEDNTFFLLEDDTFMILEI